MTLQATTKPTWVRRYLPLLCLSLLLGGGLMSAHPVAASTSTAHTGTH